MEVPAGRMAMTAYWPEVLARSDRRHWRSFMVVRRRICALHLAGSCSPRGLGAPTPRPQWGYECKNVHLCQTMFQDLWKEAEPLDPESRMHRYWACAGGRRTEA